MSQDSNVRERFLLLEGEVTGGVPVLVPPASWSACQARGKRGGALTGFTKAGAGQGLRQARSGGQKVNLAGRQCPLNTEYDPQGQGLNTTGARFPVGHHEASSFGHSQVSA